MGRCAYIVYLRLCRIRTDRFATVGKERNQKKVESFEAGQAKGQLEGGGAHLEGRRSLL